MDFKYKFQPWSGPNSRYVCPKCNKKTLVRFIDAEGNHVGSDDMGKCDRVEKCGYSYFPSKGTLVDLKEVLKPIEKPVTDYLKMSEMVGFVGDCHLKYFLRGKFKDAVIDEVFERYHVLTTDLKWTGSTVYYQIDEQYRVRTGKIMDYDSDGKRVKKPYNRIYWVHKTLDRDFNMTQCMFGAQLINKGKPIAIVESEKTALICAMEYPEYTWVATGGLQGLTPEKMKPLQDLEVVAYPDKGAYDKWCELFSKYTVKVSGMVETLQHLNQGDDLGDEVLRRRG